MGETREHVKVTGDASDANKAAESVEKSLTKAFITAEVAMRVLTKAMDLGLDAISALDESATEYTKTQTKLNSALKASGNEVEQNARALNRQAAELQDITGISDELIRGLQTMAVNMQVPIDRVDEFTRAAIAMSNTMDVDASSAMRQLTKSMSGMRGELGELVPGVSALTKEQLAAGAAIELVNDLWGENLGILVEDNYVGNITRLTRAWDDLVEVFALTISQSEELNRLISNLADNLENLATIASEAGVLNALAAVFSSPEENAAFAAALRSTRGPGDVVEKKAGGGRGGARGAGKGAGPIFSFDEAELSQAGLTGLFEQGQREEEAGLAGVAEQFQGDIDAETRRVETILALEQQIADGKEEIQQSNFDRQVKLTNDLITMEEEAAHKRTVIQQGAWDVLSKIIQDFAAVAVDALITYAEGGEVAFDQVLKGFLKSTGSQLVGQGIADILEGTGMLISTFGANPQGEALIALGAIETGTGAAMIAGSLAIPAPPAKPGAAAGADLGAGGGAPLGDTTAGGKEIRGGDTLQIFVMEDISDDTIIRIREGLDRVSGKGL